MSGCTHGMAYNQDSLDTDIVILSDPDSDLFCDVEPVTSSALSPGVLPVYHCNTPHIQPASHHALSCAYLDLKRRFNDLESKYRTVSRHIKSEKYPGVVMASSRSSQNPGRDAGVVYSSSSSNDLGTSNNHITNGDVISESEYCKVILERDDLRQELNEWKQKYEELDRRCAMNVQTETQMSQIWERIHGRNNPGSMLERHQMTQLSQENESLRLELHTMEQRLRDQSKENSSHSQSARHMEEQAQLYSRKLKEAKERLDVSRQRYESLSEEMNQLRNDLHRHQTIGRQDRGSGPNSEDLESMGVALICARQEMVKLKKMVGDQQEIIQLLLNRLRDNNGMDQTNCPAGRQEVLAEGRMVLSSSRLQTNLDQSNLEIDAGQAQQCTDDNSNKHSELVTAVDAVTKHAFLPSANTKRHTVSSIDLGMEGLLSSSENSCTPSPSRTMPLVSRSVDQNKEGLPYEPGEVRNRSQNFLRPHHGKLRWSADDVVDEGRHDYDDLTFGSNTVTDYKSDTVEWHHRGHAKERDSGEDMDSVHNDSEDLDLYSQAMGGAAAAGRHTQRSGSSLDSCRPQGMENVNQTRVGGTEIENRYRPVQSGSQPRPLNIERNDCDSSGGQSRSHDNTTQNVNLNTGASRKYPEESSSTPRPTYLNNDPLVGHKIIPNRNIYQGELQDDAIVAPLVVAPRPVAEVADGGEETRSCPVCSETFPDSVPMGQFQQHVLDCVGPPSPPQEERACPVCNTVFPEVVAQAEFEAHVNGHFPEEPLRFEIIDP